MYGKFAFFPEQASRHAENIDLVFFGLTAMSLFFILAITITIAVFAIKYRRRPGNEIAQATTESGLLEIAWSIIPLFVALGLFAWGTRVYLDLFNPPTENSIEIFAVGRQWMWKFQHPEGRREINNLHIPVNRPIKMTMISQDVIHSFFVPAFRVKQDVLPGRYTGTWFEATKPGVYHLFCTEYCGTEHSRMGGTVTVMAEADYQAWLASPMIEGGDPRDMLGGTLGGMSVAAAAGATEAEKGKAVLENKGCRACHKLDSEAVAPKLEGIYGTQQALVSGSVKVDDNYIRESVLVPTAKVVKGYMPVMPSFQGQLNEDEIRQIIAYVKSTSVVSSGVKK